jgi:hypothetical protein
VHSSENGTITIETPLEDAPRRAMLLCGIDGCEFLSKTPQGIGRHRLHTHGIPAKGKAGGTHRRASPTNDVTAEAVAKVVLAQMFPHGIPVDHLGPILRWIHDTEEFIESVGG